MTLQTLYTKVRLNKITRSQFLAEVRKDPYASKHISPANSFEDVVKILKNKQLIQEVKPKSASFNLKKQLKEVENETDNAEDESAEDESAEEVDDTSLSSDLEHATNSFLGRIAQLEGYNDEGNVALIIEKILRSGTLGYNKQTARTILNTVKSKFV